MKDYTMAQLNNIAFGLEETMTADEPESIIFHSLMEEFKSSCSVILQNSTFTEDNNKQLERQQQCQVEIEYLSVKLNNLYHIRNEYENEKQAWEDNLAFFKSPLALISTETTECIFENINDTATLSKMYDDTGSILSVLHDVRNAKEETIQCRKDLVTFYQRDVLHRWNALDSTISSIEASLTSSRQSTM